MKVTRTKLKNGFRTVIIELPDSQAVSTSIFVGAGGRYEDKKTYGISHFLEHMVFKGTKKYPTADIYANMIESIGGQQNAWTDMDHTNYYNVVPKEHRKVGFGGLLELVTNPLLRDEDINKERGVILEEANMRNDNPSVLVWDKLNGMLWPNQPIGSDIIGPTDNIKAFKHSDFVNYKNMHYHVGNMALAVAGGIKTEEVLVELEDFFGKIVEGRKSDILKVSEEQKESKVENIYKDTDQANLILAYKTFSVFDKRKIALDLLSTVIGAGFSSILFREIREKRGLAYRVEAHPEYYAETGFFAAYAGLNRDKVESAVHTIKEELFKLKNSLISDEDVVRAKEFLKGYYRLNLETANSLSNWYGRRELLFPDNPEPKEIIEKIDAVTAEELKKVANDIFDESKENLIVVGPYKDKTKFEKAIKFS